MYITILAEYIPPYQFILKEYISSSTGTRVPAPRNKFRRRNKFTSRLHDRWTDASDIEFRHDTILIRTIRSVLPVLFRLTHAVSQTSILTVLNI